MKSKNIVTLVVGCVLFHGILLNAAKQPIRERPVRKTLRDLSISGPTEEKRQEIQEQLGSVGTTVQQLLSSESTSKDTAMVGFFAEIIGKLSTELFQLNWFRNQIELLERPEEHIDQKAIETLQMYYSKRRAACGHLENSLAGFRQTSWFTMLTGDRLDRIDKQVFILKKIVTHCITWNKNLAKRLESLVKTKLEIQATPQQDVYAKHIKHFREHEAAESSAKAAKTAKVAEGTEAGKTIEPTEDTEETKDAEAAKAAQAAEDAARMERFKKAKEAAEQAR